MFDEKVGRTVPVSREVCECGSPGRFALPAQIHPSFPPTGTALLCLASGGCSRGATSRTVHYCTDPDGRITIELTSANPHIHRTFARSGLHLRISAEDGGTTILSGTMTPSTDADNKGLVPYRFSIERAWRDEASP